MNEDTAREKVLREWRIRTAALDEGKLRGFAEGAARASEVYSPRMTELEHRADVQAEQIKTLTLRLDALVKLFGELIGNDATKVAPLERNPKRPTHDPRNPPRASPA